MESLENRQLLATATGVTFNAPSLTGLITQAWQGKDTSRAAINTMLSALQSLLTSGTLADLNSGAVNGDGLVQEAQSLVASFNQNVDQQLKVDNLERIAGVSSEHADNRLSLMKSLENDFLAAHPGTIADSHQAARFCRPTDNIAPH